MDADFLLIQKMKTGNEGAINTFVHKYYPKILQYCRLHISSLDDAEDVTQETFEKFFRTLEQYQHYGKALNYLYVIASNTCKDSYKKRKEILMDGMSEHLVTDMAHVVERMDVEIALDRLPSKLKEAAVLFFFQELKQKEIAKILDISLPLVKYRIKRAREIMCAYLRMEE